MQKTLSIIVPALNEGASLPQLVERLTQVLAPLAYAPEIIIVDDGSTDTTREVILNLRTSYPFLKSVHLSRNFGKERAVAAGLAHCTGAAAILIDADLQHPPELIPDLVREFEAGYDMVYAVRRTRDTDSAARRHASRLFYSLFRFFSGTNLPEGAGDYRLLSRKAVDAMNLLGERSRFNKGLYAWIGFRSIGIPYTVAERDTGESKWAYRQLVRFALDGVASFSIMPLRLASAMGLLTSFGAIAYGIFFLIQTFVFGVDVPGYPSLIVSIMFFSGIQLICLGVLGEYLGRVYEEAKGRPLVIVDTVVGFDTVSATLPAADPLHVKSLP